jgi:hypothetical protein
MIRPWLLVISLVLVLAVPATGHSQLEVLLSPELGKLTARGEYRLTYYPEQPVSEQPADLSVTQHRLSFSAPLAQDARNEWSLSGRVRLQDYDTRAVLPDSGVRFPTELWEIRLEPAYRHRFENGRVVGAHVSLGSASDEPFASVDELVLRAMAFLRVPHRERNAWLLTFTYSNHAELLAGIPVPGLAYVYSPSDRLTAVIGLPFASVDVRPTEALSLEASYQALRNVRARATYRVFPPLRVWAGFDWDNEFHLRADRGDDEDRFYYYEKRLSGGVRFDLRHFGIELVGGYAFDRFFFEGEGYSDRHDNRIDVDSGPFVSARLSFRF